MRADDTNDRDGGSPFLAFRPMTGAALAALAIFLVVIAGIYANWMTVIWSESEDSLTFIARILDDAPRFHPNHLLFEPFYHAIQTRLSDWLPAADPVRIMQYTTLSFTLVSLAVVFILVDQRSGWRVALAATSLIAVSFGFWHYATTVDAYHPALAFATFALFAFERRPRTPTALWAVATAILAALAVLFHQLYIVFAIILGLFILFDQRGRRIAYRDFAIYTATGLVLVVGAYAYAYLGPDAAKAEGFTFIDWAKGYANNSFGAPVETNAPLMAVIGLARAVVTFNALLGVPELWAFANQTAGEKGFVEEHFVAVEAIGLPLSYVLSVTALLGLLAAFVVLMASVFIGTRQKSDALQLLILVLVVVYAALAFTWEGINLELWIHVMAFATILAFRWLGQMRAVLTRLVTATVCLIAVTNFFGAVRPYTDIKNDYWMEILDPVLNTAQAGDLVIIACPWLCGEYIETLTGAAVAAPSELQSDYVVSDYANVYLSSLTLTGQAESVSRRIDALQQELAGPLPAADAAMHTLWLRESEDWRSVAAKPGLPQY